MATTRWKWNLAGFTALRHHPALVAAMESAADTAAAGSPLEVRVTTFRTSGSGRGRGGGSRTTVQIWAAPSAARRVNRNPGEMTAILNQVHL